VVDAPSLASFIAVINGGATTLIKCFTDLAILVHSASTTSPLAAEQQMTHTCGRIMQMSAFKSNRFQFQLTRRYTESTNKIQNRVFRIVFGKYHPPDPDLRAIEKHWHLWNVENGLGTSECRCSRMCSG
jgi:hypothetical protein